MEGYTEVFMVVSMVASMVVTMVDYMVVTDMDIGEREMPLHQCQF